MQKISTIAELYAENGSGLLFLAHPTLYIHLNHMV